MAELLLSQRGSTNSTPKLGKNWVTKFLQRNPELKSKYIYRYDYSRAKYEDLAILQQFFDAFCDTVIKYGILDADVYNFDETGFAIGIIATTIVVSMAENTGKPRLLQPGNQE